MLKLSFLKLTLACCQSINLYENLTYTLHVAHIYRIKLQHQEYMEQCTTENNKEKQNSLVWGLLMLAPVMLHMIKIYISTFILSTQNPFPPSPNGVAADSSKYPYTKLYVHANATTSNPVPPGNMSGHYEVDEDYGDPYWDPSSMEDELRMQLQMLKVQEIPREDLQ